jgi:hypothetical protein
MAEWNGGMESKDCGREEEAKFNKPDAGSLLLAAHVA